MQFKIEITRKQIITSITLIAGLFYFTHIRNMTNQINVLQAEVKGLQATTTALNAQKCSVPNK
ncbi:hypothetical protein IQ250_26150 [Pseudanabaenaceae cyanobacterium LEGE 13415]|nr:hypothetical protein [Pseudanabaenaceae cyanobacterium LEGE 13415]